MAKDPAMLFYTSDFLTGTMLMNDQQVGKYIRVICLIHQSGGQIDRAGFDAFVTDPIVRSKFTIKKGFVSQKRVSSEMEKRVKYCESRRKNKLGSKNICQSYVKHMENENAIENEINNTTKNNNTTKAKKTVTFVRDNPPTVPMIADYCTERKNGIDPQAFHDKNTTIGWIDKHKIPYRDWKAVVRTWENYRKSTSVTSIPVPIKRPVMLVVVEKIAAGMSNHDILHDLVGTYTEHDINEALIKARSKGDSDG